MDATFLNDLCYDEACGNRKVRELVSTLCNVFDRHEQAFPPSVLKANTVRRSYNLPSMTEEISSLESVLAETEGTFEYFWKTATYLHEKMSVARKRMELLREKKKKQEKLCLRLETALRRPTLPREIMDTILGLISSHNRLRWEETTGTEYVYVDGLVPLSVYSPPLLLPYYDKPFDSTWSLGMIAWQTMKRAILDDASLTNYIKLRVEFCHDFSNLRLLMNYPHLWEKLDISTNRLLMQDFVDCFETFLPSLEELNIVTHSITSSYNSAVVPLDGRRLKAVSLPFLILPDLFSTGCLKSITSLRLYSLEPSYFANHVAFKQALNTFPRSISQLTCLYDLEVDGIDCKRNDLEGLSKIKSSLRSLCVHFTSDDSVVASAFLNLFTDCNVSRINIQERFLREASDLFRNAQQVYVRINRREIPLVLEYDGNPAFPEMYQLELSTICVDFSEIQLQQLQDVLLQTVRTRFENPAARRIYELRIQKGVMKNVQFQEELERYLPSLILTY